MKILLSQTRNQRYSDGKKKYARRSICSPNYFLYSGLQNINEELGQEGHISVNRPTPKGLFSFSNL